VQDVGVIRRALPLAGLLLGATALVAGCAARPAAPTATAAPTPARSVTPLVTPTVTSDEITRSVFSGGTVDARTGAVPASGSLSVDVACWGADGSTLTWALVDGDGTAIGLSGVADCSGPPSTSGIGITAATRPKAVRVELRPGSGAVSGYAIVRRSSF
jgi:hypothetical protein